MRHPDMINFMHSAGATLHCFGASDMSNIFNIAYNAQYMVNIVMA